ANSPVPAEAVRDLIESGHLEAIDASSLSGPAFVDPRSLLPAVTTLACWRSELVLHLSLARLASMFLPCSSGCSASSPRYWLLSSPRSSSASCVRWAPNHSFKPTPLRGAA